MSDLYNEATRHEYIRVPKYLAFLGGGLVAVLFVAMGLWMTVTTEEAVVEPLETVEEADFRRMAAQIAGARALAPEPELSEQRPVRARLTREIADARELAEAAATVLSEVTEDEVFSVVLEGAALRIRAFGGASEAGRGRDRNHLSRRNHLQHR